LESLAVRVRMYWVAVKMAPSALAQEQSKMVLL
jgi:hypothetical protein